jgi:hypothetical protein
MTGRKLPTDQLPNAEERFKRLLGSMAPPAVEIPEEEPEASAPERGEDCGDIQTPTDTSEDAS